MSQGSAEGVIRRSQQCRYQEHTCKCFTCVVVLQAIAAFDDAVKGMQQGGIRRIEVLGAVPELGYSLDRRQRFTDELISADLKLYKYRKGPQPVDLGGQRSLDFVLDNPTLRDFNRNLVFDIKLLAVR